MHHLALLQFSLILIFVQCGSTVINRHLQTTSYPSKIIKYTPFFLASLKDLVLHNQFSQYSASNLASTPTTSISGNPTKQQGQMMSLQSKKMEAMRAIEELPLLNKQKNNERRKQQQEEMKQKKEEDEAACCREE
jgi:hypothetical protein